MSKKINVRPVETLTIEFEDGSKIECKFTAYSMYILDSEFEGFIEVFESAEKKPFEAGAKLLYAGLKTVKDEITFMNAKAIVCSMSIENIMELFKFATDTLQTEKKQLPG